MKTYLLGFILLPILCVLSSCTTIVAKVAADEITDLNKKIDSLNNRITVLQDSLRRIYIDPTIGSPIGKYKTMAFVNHNEQTYKVGDTLKANIDLIMRVPDKYIDTVKVEEEETDLISYSDYTSYTYTLPLTTKGKFSKEGYIRARRDDACMVDYPFIIEYEVK